MYLLTDTAYWVAFGGTQTLPERFLLNMIYGKRNKLYDRQIMKCNSGF
jgi:hypothetical protein